MSESLESLIQQPEPWPLEALQVVLALLGLMSLPAALVAAIIGFDATIWLYAFLALIASATLAALVANRWSEHLFARRAEPLGVTRSEARSEARSFWRTYDWDEANA